MKGKAKFIRDTGKILVYSIPSVAALDSGVLAGIRWKKETAGLEFKVESDTGKEYEALARNVPGHYGVTLSYSVAAADLRFQELKPGVPKVKLEVIVDPKELKAMFLETYIRYFLLPWADKVGHHELSGGGAYVKNRLPSSVGVHVKIRGRIVGGLISAVMPGEGNSEPFSRIGWIWIAPELKKDFRLAAHYALCEWMRSLKTSRLQCFIESYNLRSQKFFRKLGFRLDRVLILRK